MRIDALQVTKGRVLNQGGMVIELARQNYSELERPGVTYSAQNPGVASESGDELEFGAQVFHPAVTFDPVAVPA